MKLDMSNDPVLSDADARKMANTIMQMASLDTVQIYLTHTNRQITRFSNNRLLAFDQGDILTIFVVVGSGLKASISIDTNQADLATLKDAVQRAETLARAQTGWGWDPTHVPMGAQEYVPVSLYKDETVAALWNQPEIFSQLIDPIKRAGFNAAGFVGIMARSSCVVNRDGIGAYYRETDCECTVSARSLDGKASGWYGQANRDWSKIDSAAVSQVALETAQRSVGVQALEPGRRTVILNPVAVAQLVGEMTYAYDAENTNRQLTPFYSDRLGRNKLGQHVFDRRISMISDPADPDGGYRPYFRDGLPTPKMTYIDNGVLANMAYQPGYAMAMGKPFATLPYSMRMSGGNTSIDDMIASCQEGVYINRLSDIQVMSPTNGMMTGVTRDGCFFIKNGKIDRPVKNFRFTDSPWFFLNRIEAMGVPIRASFGFSPPPYPVSEDDPRSWPRIPMIVPPLMIKDFNLSALSDAV